MPDRESLGRLVRQVWVDWAREQPDPKPTWTAGFDEIDDGQREVDMRIGEALYEAGRRAERAKRGYEYGVRRPDGTAYIPANGRRSGELEVRTVVDYLNGVREAGTFRAVRRTRRLFGVPPGEWEEVPTETNQTKE